MWDTWRSVVFPLIRKVISLWFSRVWFTAFLFLCTCCWSQHTSHSQYTGASWSWSTEISSFFFLRKVPLFLFILHIFKLFPIFLPCGRMETFSQGSDLIYILFLHDFTTFFSTCTCCLSQHTSHSQYTGATWSTADRIFFLRKVPLFLSILHIFKLLPIFPPC